MPGQGGAAWFDYDNDGWYDLYLTGGSAPDAFFRNNGDGSFSDKTVESGLNVLQNVYTDGVTTGDYNRDGWNDIFVTTFRTSPNYLLLNNGDGTFTAQTNWAGAQDTVNSFSATFGDLNMDGWLDLFVCNWSRFMNVTISGPNVSVDSDANFYYENDGDGTFTEKASEYGFDDSLGCALGVIITDFDNDQDVDLFVANDFGYFFGNSPNRLYENNYPTNSFSEVSELFGMDVGMNGMGVAKTDMNGDGRLDYYITNIRDDKLMVGSVSGFEDELIDAGLHNDSVWLQDLSQRHWKVGWGAGFLDIDNDMDEDLMVANGSLAYDYPHPALDSNKLYLNNSDGTFSDISFEIGVADTYVSRALAYCDYDLDGDLDVFIGITDSIGGTRTSFLYRNDSPAQNWLEVKATGVQTNTNGISVRVVVYVNGVRLIREIGGESSYNSQHWQVAHFGLAQHMIVDSMQVIWPGAGIDRYYSIASNQFIEVVEGQGLITGIEEDIQSNMLVHPNPFTDIIRIEAIGLQVIELLDLKGSVVFSQRGLKSNSEIDVSGIANGTYLLRAELSGGTIVLRRIVKR